MDKPVSSSERPIVFPYVGIDADIFKYRCSFATQDGTEKDCADSIDALMEYTIAETVIFDMGNNVSSFLTGKGNFRYDIAVTYDYKGNRKQADKPKHFEFAQEYLISEWNAELIEGMEADDALSIQATELGEGYVIASTDKDLKTVPGWHFNPTKGEFLYMTEWESLQYFYEQILTGDRVDNIIGLYRVGPKKAQGILSECKTEEEMFDACLEAYKSSPTLEGDPYDRLLENARLLHMLRYEGQLWQPPM